MRNNKWLRLVAILSVLSLVLAACGGDDAGEDTVETTTTTEAPATTAAPDMTTTTEDMGDEPMDVGGDGVLTIGTLLPVTGDLAFLGPPEVAGARLAVQDINDAGGVFGTDVVLVEGDSGDTNQDIANPEVDRLLAEGVDSIHGAASSAVSKLVIDKITGNDVIQFSPANTSADFTTYDDNGLYFRTAPSDLLQGQVVANQLLDQGNETIGIIFRQESYGQGLAETIRDNFEAAGGVVDPYIPYAVDTENFDAEVDQLAAAAPDGIVVIGFAESANILTTMHERGIGPVDGVNVWGTDGNYGIGTSMADPSILAGFRATTPSVDLSAISDFTDRLDTAYEGGVGGIFAYGAETYDSVIITALAALVAGVDDSVAIAAEINGVTKDGEKCTSFAECKDIIEAGGNPDYDGVGGPYEFVDAGEPNAASFLIVTYDGEYDADPSDEVLPGALYNPELDEYVFAS